MVLKDLYSDRFLNLVNELCYTLSDYQSDTLIQVWLPEYSNKGYKQLSTAGLPYATSGCGNLLTLYRFISSKYAFGTNSMEPHNLGAVGRVYATQEIEMCSNVQQYDKRVFIRVNEAQRCCVHSVVILPLFDTSDKKNVLGVLEIAKNEHITEFPDLLNHVSASLLKYDLCTSEPDLNNLVVGLKKWTMDIELLLFDSKYRQIPHLENNKHFEADEDCCCQSVSQIKENHNLSIPQINNDTIVMPMESHSEVSLLKQRNNQINSITHETNESYDTGEFLYGHKVKSMEFESYPIHSNIEFWQAYHNDKEREQLKDLLDKMSGKKKSKNKRRSPMGSGKHLTFNELKQHFGLNLKEAAEALKICPTTLKRACRRNGIECWPSRQISKLDKTMKKMGFGKIPKQLVDYAMTGKLKANLFNKIISDVLSRESENRDDINIQSNLSKNTNKSHDQDFSLNTTYDNQIIDICENMNESNDSFGMHVSGHHHTDDILVASQPIMTNEMSFKDHNLSSTMLDIPYSDANVHQHNFMHFNQL